MNFNQYATSNPIQPISRPLRHPSADEQIAMKLRLAQLDPSDEDACEKYIEELRLFGIGVEGYTIPHRTAPAPIHPPMTYGQPQGCQPPPMQGYGQPQGYQPPPMQHQSSTAQPSGQRQHSFATPITTTMFIKRADKSSAPQGASVNPADVTDRFKVGGCEGNDDAQRHRDVPSQDAHTAAYCRAYSDGYFAAIESWKNKVSTLPRPPRHEQESRTYWAGKLEPGNPISRPSAVGPKSAPKVVSPAVANAAGNNNNKFTLPPGSVEDVVEDDKDDDDDPPQQQLRDDNVPPQYANARAFCRADAEGYRAALTAQESGPAILKQTTKITKPGSILGQRVVVETLPEEVHAFAHFSIDDDE